ncbi:MAG: LacI family DNA-binding transcriptional regulator [Anaerolineae bacterium]|nr:LacI family DNA-binding transcriptional regulator [Anaerolineae bacterium]
MPPLTLDEIARLAGVSRTTASRVLNDRPHVRPELRERVLRVIEETNYRPNLLARSLAFQESRMIGLVVPQSVHAFFSDPYFPRLTQGIAEACNQYEYTLSLFLVQTFADESKLLPKITSRGFLDGLIVQVGQREDSLIGALAESGLPLVVAGRPSVTDKVSYIDVDNVHGAYTAVMHLLELGRRRVATITGGRHTAVGADRLRGYEQALAAMGLPVDPALIVEGDFTENSAYLGMQQLLPHHPDAVFAASDVMAVGALRAIQHSGLQVPRDIAVVGYDDLPPALLVSPTLTTIRQPIRRFGIRAVELLLDLIQNGTHPPRQVLMGTELVVRESCGFAA